MDLYNYIQLLLKATGSTVSHSSQHPSPRVVLNVESCGEHEVRLEQKTGEDK